MSSARRPSKTETRLDYEVNQSSHGFSVGTILTHTGSAYAAAKADTAANAEVIGVVSEVENTDNFTVQTSGHITGLTGLTAGTVYFLSDTTAGTATSTEPTISKPVYYSSSTTEATMLNFRGSDSTLTGGGSGDMVLVSTATASSDASIDFTDLDSTYYNYIVEIQGLIPSTDSVVLRMRTSTNNGSSYDSGASDYGWMAHGADNDNTTSSGRAYGDSITSYISLTLGDGGVGLLLGTASGEEATFKVEIKNPSEASYTYITCSGAYINSTNRSVKSDNMGVRRSAAAVDAIQLYMSSGNISSGTFKLYGIK